MAKIWRCKKYEYPLACLILWSLCIASIFLSFSTSNLNINAANPVNSSVPIIDTQYQHDSNTLNLNGYGTNINLVVNFVNDKYFRLFEKWFIVFNNTFHDQADLENNVLLLTVCLDDGAFDKISAITEGIHVQLLQYNILTLNINHIQQCYMRYTFIFDNTLPTNGETKTLIWFYRLCVLKHLFDSNNRHILSSLILTDTDAYWLKNPYTYLHQYSFIDIMASPGRWPKNCHLRTERPSVLIMGFIFFNNTLKNKQILNETYTKCKMQGRRCDDQTILNCGLLQKNLTFIDNRTQSHNHNSINIHYLPLKYFCRRNCMQLLNISDVQSKHDLYIAHPSRLGQKIKTSRAKKIEFKLLDNYISRKSNFNLQFVHIPKTAGSTVGDVLKRKFNIKVGRYRFRSKYSFQCVCYDWHCPVSYFAERNLSVPALLDPEQTDLFTVVRNPFDRYMSEYKYCYGNDRFPCWKSVLRGIGFVGSRQDDFCDVSRFNDVTSIIFEGLLKNNIKWHLENCHFVPQSNFIYYKKEKIMKHVIRFEDLENEFIALLQLFEDTRNITKSDLKNSLYLTERPPSNCSNLVVDDINETNKQLIRQYYVNDFEHFYPAL